MYLGFIPSASNGGRYEVPMEVIDDETGEGIDLTDYVIRFSIRDKQSDAQVLYATNDDGIEINDPLSGVFELILTPTQMGSLSGKDYYARCTIHPEEDEELKTQFIIGSLQVYEGKVDG